MRGTLPGPADSKALADAMSRLPGGAVMVAVDLFGTGEEIASMERTCREAGMSPPLTRVISTAAGFGGLQFVAVSGCPVSPLLIEGSLLGFLVEGGGDRFLYLGGVTPPDISSPPEVQTEAVFAQIERALAEVGMSFADVARTWFYNDRILDWYPAFNAVRTSYFERHGIRRMPASTGIGAPNPSGAALVAKVIATDSKRPGGVVMEPVRSPLQCDAFAYGSAFSRAIMVSDSTSRTLHISGTASIEPGGKTVHCGDPESQIHLTMDVVGAILQEAGMELADTTRAIAYFRNPSDVPLWSDYFSRCGISGIPVVILCCDVCRDDLLFELELEASALTG